MAWEDRKAGRCAGTNINDATHRCGKRRREAVALGVSRRDKRIASRRVSKALLQLGKTGRLGTAQAATLILDGCCVLT